MQRRALRLALQKKLSPKRYQHVLRVARLATRLARQQGVPPDSAYTAALLHDVERELPNSDLSHGHLGAQYAQKVFGITDPDIFNAIRYHTTGRKQMSTLEKIIYVADYCEPGRTIAIAHTIRKQLYKTKDLNRAVQQKKQAVLEYLQSNLKEKTRATH